MTTQQSKPIEFYKMCEVCGVGLQTEHQEKLHYQLRHHSPSSSPLQEKILEFRDRLDQGIRPDGTYDRASRIRLEQFISEVITESKEAGRKKERERIQSDKKGLWFNEDFIWKFGANRKYGGDKVAIEILIDKLQERYNSLSTKEKGDKE